MELSGKVEIHSLTISGVVGGTVKGKIALVKAIGESDKLPAQAVHEVLGQEIDDYGDGAGEGSSKKNNGIFKLVREYGEYQISASAPNEDGSTTGPVSFVGELRALETRYTATSRTLYASITVSIPMAFLQAVASMVGRDDVTISTKEIPAPKNGDLFDGAQREGSSDPKIRKSEAAATETLQ